ncbi:hypothetical protein BBF96_11120 [Anoxybacter fermentans]|uniref:Flagellar protein FliT n=1 Tax=Anoxybacter fermentans TaxID=1323375 RepID=A0A3Q9HT62_9FIRM|nr:hypothetical protein [Anoxybacter fermentans]AZR73890.1 hypothetical protein BBF96_11120 [Anoxybacter fermentans]
MNLSLCKSYLEQKLALCEKLLKITDDIYNMLDSDDLRDLEEKMGFRTKLIAEINYLDSIYLSKCDLTKAMSTEHGDDIIRLREIFTTIQEIDEKIKDKISSLKEYLSKEYSLVKKARKIQSAYDGNEGRQGFFLNRQR